MSKRCLYILRGPSGCGKSMYASSFPESDLIISADDYHWRKAPDDHGQIQGPHRIIDGVLWEYAYKPENAGKAHADCLMRFLKAIQNHYVKNIVLDNTNIHAWEYQHYVEIACMEGLHVTVHEFCVTDIRMIPVLAERNSHGVPIEVIAKQCYEFEPTIPEMETFKHEVTFRA